MKLITVAWRNVGRNRRRTALSLGAIAVAALSIVFLFAYIAGMKADIVSNLINYYTGEVRLRHKDFEAFERFNPLHLRVQDAAETVQALSALDEVSAVSPRLSFPGAIFRDEQTLGLQGLGLDFDRERAYQDLSAILLSGTLPDKATTRGRRVAAALGRALAERLNLKIGDDFTVLATTMSRGNNAMTFEVTGLLEFPVGSLNGTTFIAPLAAIQRLVQKFWAVGCGNDQTVGCVRLDKLQKGVKDPSHLTHIIIQGAFTSDSVKFIKKIHTLDSLDEVEYLPKFGSRLPHELGNEFIDLNGIKGRAQFVSQDTGGHRLAGTWWPD